MIDIVRVYMLRCRVEVEVNDISWGAHKNIASHAIFILTLSSYFYDEFSTKSTLWRNLKWMWNCVIHPMDDVLKGRKGRNKRSRVLYNLRWGSIITLWFAPPLSICERMEKVLFANGRGEEESVNLCLGSQF